MSRRTQGKLRKLTYKDRDKRAARNERRGRPAKLKMKEWERKHIRG